ncbi:Tetratricopeptide repeat family protein [Giardia duodenalis]|uniref:IFT complex A n=2 Tax=Giardia intestinalis TaxID=5741 RepID=C6LPE7_GIAIB|nr:IFT complex A [Giardia intestinalis ATCC 50581]ESU44800.1 Tetratricopeptide repeat family protein [Giardia intestinalis]
MIQITIDIILEDPTLCVVQVYTQTSSQTVFALLSDGSLAVLHPNDNNELVLASKTSMANQLPVDILRKVITTDEGQVQVPITALACHPFVENLVVVGFKDGSFSIWFPNDSDPSYKTELHQDELCLIKWLSHGRILATCDISGQVILYKFSTDTYSFESITKTRKSGHVVDIVERTCCTDNIIYSIDQEHGDQPIDVSTYAGVGLCEFVVMWSKGDVAVLTDNGVIRHIGTVNISSGRSLLYKLYYWGCSDTCCAISTAGDVFLFGFKTLAVGAYKDILAKYKIEYKRENGIIQLSATKIAYMAPSDGQLRILNLLTQEVAYIDLEDYVDNFVGVNGCLAVIKDFGVLIPLRGKNGYAVVSCHHNSNYLCASNNEGMRILAASDHYLHANDMRFARAQDSESLGTLTGQDEFTVTEQHFLHAENPRCSYANIYMNQVIVGDNTLSQTMITNYSITNRNSISNEMLPVFYDEDGKPINLPPGFTPETASTPEGVDDATINSFSAESISSRGKFVSLLLFSFEPKDMQVSYANNTNSAIMAQDLTGEGLTHMKFLDQKFTESRNSFISAVLIGARTIKISLNTSTNILQEHALEIKHPVKKISLLTNPLTSISMNNLSGYVLIFGNNVFTVFEVTIGKIPHLAGSFKLDERYTYVADCVLYGRYILASQNSRTDLESDYTKVEIVKYSITGSKAGSLVLSDDPIHGATIERIARMTLVNQHLFMINNNLTLFYADCKTFNSVVKVTDIGGLLFNTDLYYAYPEEELDSMYLPDHDHDPEIDTPEAEAKSDTQSQTREEKIKDLLLVENTLQINQQLNDRVKQKEKERNAISVRTTLSTLIPLDTICVQSCNATVTLDNAHHVLFTLVFKGYNVVTGLPCLLPYVVALSIDTKVLGEMLDVTQTVTSPQSTDKGSDKLAAGSDKASAVLKSRIFDMAPYTITNAMPDCFGNIGLELVLSTSLNLLFIGSSMLFALKTGTFTKRALNAKNLSQYLSWLDSKGRMSQGNTELSFQQEKYEEQISLLQSLCTTHDQRSRIPLLVQSFAETTVSMNDRVRGSMFDFNDKIFLSIQGVFAPYANSKLETLIQPLTSTMLTLLSPSFVFSERNGKSEKPRTSNFVSINSDRLTIRNLTALGSSNKVGFQQSCTATYALNKFTICSNNGQLSEAYSHVLVSENLHVWRSLATLCIQNGYVDLLKTCTTHLKSPMLSLLMRLVTGRGRPVVTNATSSQLDAKIAPQDELLLALLSISLGACSQGLDRLQENPLLLSGVMNDIGLSIRYLLKDGKHNSLQQSGGLTSLAKKSSILSLANRLTHLNDTESAKICYSEVYKASAAVHGEIDSLNANPKLILQQNESVQFLNDEYKKKGIAACLTLAKKGTDPQFLYAAARLVESEAKSKDSMSATHSGAADSPDQQTLWLEAARLYKRCNAFTHALACALKCKDDELIYNIGTTSQSQRLSLVAATYFSNKYKNGLMTISEKGKDGASEDFYDELQTNIEYALVLYKAAGLGAQSLELCIKSNRMKELSNLLADILSEPSKSVDRELDDDGVLQDHTSTQGISDVIRGVSSDLLLRAGRALLDVSPEDYSLNDYNSFIRTAVIALAKASAYQEALQAILDGKIQISERIADILTPTSVENDEEAIKVTEALGKLLHKAGLYQSAVKKFILAQNHTLAINSLIKQGDPMKVIKFANMARQKQVYIAASNFLQTLDWRSNPTYMKAIISFYEKANSLENIAKFFANCAVEEISEYHDYVKAKQAIIEAMKRQKVAIEYVEQNASSKESEKVAAARAAKVASLKDTLQTYEQNGKLIHAFLQLCDFARDTSQAHDSSETLTTNSSKLLAAVRKMNNCYVKPGDIMGLLAEFHGVRGEKARIVSIIKDMRSEGIDPEKYLDAELYAAHAAEAGITVDDRVVGFEDIDLAAEKSDH